MNKIFRVIWSDVTQSWIAVSELTKAHKKQSRVNQNHTVYAYKVLTQLFKLSAISLSLIIGGSALAANEVTNTTWYLVNADPDKSNPGHNPIVIGQNAKVGIKNATPPANGAVNQSIAIGGGNADGEGAWAKGDQSIAIGANVRADGDSSVAIGGDDVDKVVNHKINYTNSKDQKVKDVTIGNAFIDLTGKNLHSPKYSDTISGHAAVAVGTKATSSHLSVAIGTMANAGTKRISDGDSHNVEFSAFNTVAIGAGTEVDVDNGIAIGGGAKTDKHGTSELNATIGSLKYIWTGGEKIASGDIVSFGAQGFERQLKNIAPGKVSADSTDGINGSQLFGILDTLVGHNYLKYAGDDGQTDTTKIINQSLDKNRLNLVGGADVSKLSDKNIGVVYEEGNNVENGADLKPSDEKYKTGKLRVQLAKELTNLTSATFNTTGSNPDTVKIDSTGISITPSGSTDPAVTLTKEGLNNGDKHITHVAGNLPDTHNKVTGNNPQDATKKQDAPENAVTSNVATVGDVLNAGWNLKNNTNDVDFVKPYDTVSFDNGEGTEVEVKSEDGKTSIVKVKVKKSAFTTTDGNITAETAGDTFATAGDVATEINKRRIKYFSVKSDVAGNSLNDGAHGTNSIAIGPNASTASDKVRGDGAIEETNAGIAIGMNANSSGPNAVAIGPGSQSAGTNGVVVGLNATSAKADSIAIGRNASTKEINGTAVGFGASAGSINSSAFGYGVNASGPGAVAIGTSAQEVGGGKLIPTTASGQFATGIGVGVQARGLNSFAGGYLSEANATYAVAIGASAISEAAAGTAIGFHAGVKKDAVTSIALGNTATAEAKRAVALGSRSVANVEGGISGISMDSDDRANIYKALKDNTNNAKTSGEGLGAISIGSNTDSGNHIDGAKTEKFTRQLINLAAGKEDTDAVNVAQLKSVNLGFTGNSGKGDVRLFDQRVAIKGAEGSFITTTANNATIEITTTRATLTPNTSTGAVDAPENDGLTTAKNVANAINSAAWKAKATNTANGESSGGADHKVKAGDLVNFEADKNIKITQADGKFTFATKDNVEFTSVQLGSNTGPKLTQDGNNIKVGDKDGQPTKITNLAKGDVSETSTDAVNGSQLYALASNTIKLSAVNKIGSSDGAKTSTTPQNLNKQNGLEFNVKSADGELLAVKAEGDTITLTPMKGSVQIDGDGKATLTKSATNPATTEGLVEAGDLVEALNQMGWKVTSGTEGTGRTATGHTTSAPIVKFGETVTFKAGDNLLMKQAGKDFTYSLNPTLSGLTSAQFKNGDNVLSITPTGITITKPADPAASTPAKTVTLNQDGLNNGGNHIANVAGNLPATRNAQEGNNAVTTSQTAPTIGTNAGDVNTSNAATVGDVLNAGWNLKNNTNAVDFVKPYDTVDFTNGTGTTVEVKSDDHATSTVKVNIKTDGSTITVNNDGNVSAVTGDTSVVENTAGDKKKGQVQANSGDEHKLVTVENMTKAVNAAKWFAKAVNNDTAISDSDKTTNDSGEAMTAGDELSLTAGKNLRVKREAKNFTFSVVEKPEFTGLTLKDGDKVVNVAPTENGLTLSKPKADGSTETAPVNIRGVTSGLDQYDNTTPKTAGLVNLNKQENGKPNVANDTAATVGDLRNMGWVVSSDKTTGGTTEFSSAVKNANEVRFVGEGAVEVSGKKDAQSVNIITVKVDEQTGVNKAQLPVEYTTADGKKVYPVINSDGSVTYHTTPDGKGKDDAPVAPENVMTSINGPKGTTTPTTLANVEGNLQGAKTNTMAPVTHAAAPTLGTGANEVNSHNAATVGDVLNAGWNLQGNGSAVDFVKPFDTVNFIDGIGTKAEVKTAENGALNTVTFNVDQGTLTVDPDGSVKGPDMKALEEAVTKAQDALTKAEQADNANSTPETKKALEEAKNNLKHAQNAVTNAPNQVAAVQNVAKAINESGFTLKTSATDGGEKLNGTKNDGELIHPSNVVEMVAGKNLTVKQDEKGKITYATADNVNFNSVKVGEPESYTDENNQPLVKVNGQYYHQNDVVDGAPTNTAQPVPAEKVKTVNPQVNLARENAKSASNNAKDNAPSSTLNITSTDGKPTQLTGVGSSLNVTTVETSPKGKDGTYPNGKPQENLIDLKGTDAAPINKNAAATVGDLANMGWVVSAKAGNNYVDVVKNANQVDFVGKNGITITGNTDDKGVRTITVEAAQSPIVYTDVDGEKLIKGEDGNFYPADSVKIGDQYYPAGTTVNAQGNPVQQDGTTVATPVESTDPADVVASLNDGNDDTTNPLTLSNVKSNLPQINDAKKTVTLPDGSEEDVNEGWPKAGYIDAETAADLLDPNSEHFAGNNAASVGDVLNAGWNLQGNGSAVDFVKPFDTVNFIDGKGTKAVVTSGDNLVSNVTFDVDSIDITVDEKTGSIITPKQAAENKVKAAEEALAKAPTDETLKKAVEEAKADLAKVDSKVATAQNVANAISKAGFTLKTSANGGEKLAGSDELINPSDIVDMAAGKNLTVRQDEHGKVTYATKDNVDFTTVKVGAPETYKDGENNDVVKVGNDFYKASDLENGKPTKDAKPLDPKVVKAENPQVNLAREAAKPASNNAKDNAPSSALNITSTDGKPTQLTGVGSILNVTTVETSPKGKDGKDKPSVELVDLKGTDAAPINKNAAATVGDLANMGWVVSTQDGNGYVDVVKNANKVDFKGEGLASVKGETLADGTRRITVSVKGGEVTPTDATLKDHPETKLVKVGDKYYKADDLDPTGKPKQGADAIDSTNVVNTPNNGAGFVTGNQVGDAIQTSGFVIGKQKTALTAADYKDEDERVNPDDNLRFADGNNTQVKLATKESVDASGKKVTTTTVKVDVTGLPVQYTDADGNRVTKVGDKFFYVDENGNPTGDALTDEEAGDLVANVIHPNAEKDGIGDVTTLGNVKSNLPQINDAKKTVVLPDGSEEAADEGWPKAGYIDAETAADLLDPNSNHFAGNNAATVGDVLNAGWNLQGNGRAVDFVKPFDTVNFIDGKGTKAVVTNTDNRISNVTFDVDNVDLTVDEKTGEIITPKQVAENKVKAAEEALAKSPNDEALKQAVEAAKTDLASIDSKVATAQNVANAINQSGFTLKTSATAEGKKESGTKDDGELINPGKTVEMVAGKNLAVKQDEHGKVTYATTDNVDFTTVKVGAPETYKDGENNEVVKVGNDFYKASDLENGKPTKDAKPLDPKVVKAENPQVNLAREAAKPASNNAKDNAPSSALNITSTDGKPTQLTGVGSSLNVTTVETAPQGKDGDKSPVELVDLKGSKAAPVNKNAAATVGDLANMGWIVGAPDNGYTDAVKNANKVDFKGGNGIEVTGKTTKEGVRELTVAIKSGDVVSTNKAGTIGTITTPSGKTNVVKVGDNWYPADQLDANGKPLPNAMAINETTNPVTVNNGSGFVTGNQVGDAIEQSGWNLGLANADNADKAFADPNKALTADKLEKVNPEDNVRFADGKNTKVRIATVDEVNKDGKTITNTYVKTDVELPISQIQNDDEHGGVTRDANGNVVKQVGDQWYLASQLDEKGKPKANATALSAPQVKDIHKTKGNVVSMDPDGKGEAYTSTATREKGLTPEQVGELIGKQTVAADKAADKVEKLLAGQPQAVINAAKEAARKTAEDEVKAQYLKDNHLDQGVGGTVISNVAWGKAPGDAVNVDQLQNSGWNVDSAAVEGTNGRVISGNTQPTKVKMDETVNINAGNNIEITRNGRDIAVATSKNPEFNTVKLGEGDKAVTIGANQNGDFSVENNAGAPVKITNVANGTIAPNSTDAVNGGQIFALTGGNAPNVANVTLNHNGTNTTYNNVVVDEKGDPLLVTYNVQGQTEYVTNSVLTAVKNINEQGIKFFHTNDGKVKPVDQRDNSIDASAAGAYSTAIGYQTKAGANYTVAVGYNANVTGADSIAIGRNNTVTGEQSLSVGTNNTVRANHAGAIGDPSLINEGADGSYVVGNNANIKTGDHDTFVFGNNVTVTTRNSVFLGTESAYVEANANSDNSINEITSTTAGTHALTQQVTGGALNRYAGGKQGEVVGVVSVGRVARNANNEVVHQTRRIQNVAPGLLSENSTDAVNGSQLYSVASNVNHRLGDLNHRVNKLGKRMDASVAGAVAIANLLQPHREGQSAATAAIGQSRGQAAVAVGYSRLSDNGKYGVKLSLGANTQGEVNTGAGVAYFW